jgi:hypothetical protein
MQTARISSASLPLQAHQHERGEQDAERFHPERDLA